MITNKVIFYTFLMYLLVWFLSSTTQCQYNNLPSLYFFSASQNILRSTEPSFLTTLLPPSAHCPSNAPSLNASVHLPSLPTQHFEAAEKMSPYMVIPRGQNGSSDLKRLQLEVEYNSRKASQEDYKYM